MQYLIKPNNGMWVFGVLKEQEIKERILNSDVVFSDLDDTDIKTTTPIIIKEGFKRYFYNSKFIDWWVRTTIKHKAKPNQYSWDDYTKKFIDEKEKRRISAKVRKRAEKHLFPGVEEFYSLIDAYKVCVTRNLKVIGEVFRKRLKLDEVFGKSRDKGKVVSDFVETHPEFINYVVKGDSWHDEAMIDALDFYKKRGRIKEYTGIWVTKKPHFNQKFDLNIGRDYTGLVSLLK